MGKLRKNIAGLRIKFIVKLGTMGTYDDGVDKYHLIVPKEYGKQIKDLKGKQVRVVVDDEI
jgi:hypothetical protein